jgi:hypothetical protein
MKANLRRIRQEFEAWAKGWGFDTRRNGAYEDSRTQKVWMDWLRKVAVDC